MSLNLLLKSKGKKPGNLLGKEVIELKPGRQLNEPVGVDCKQPFRHKALNEDGVLHGHIFLTLNKQVLYICSL